MGNSMQPANFFTNVSPMMSPITKKKGNIQLEVEHAQIGHALLPVFSAKGQKRKYP